LTVQPDISGRGQVIWDGRDSEQKFVSSGIYLFRARFGEDRAAFKGVLLK
jgi:hypothetical protein